MEEIKPVYMTPLVKIDGIYAKLECVHPCGSIKDRIAQYIIDESEKLNVLKNGMNIVEATSGNTGISLGYFAREKGYPVTIVMPEHVTEERKKMIEELGARLILCSAEGSFNEAVLIRDQIVQNNSYFNPDQFSNPLNVECHYNTTGKEIILQMDNEKSAIHAFVAGVGTGGTLMGVGKKLMEIFTDVHIAAVEPEESAVMSGGKAGFHEIGGIGDGFIPEIVQEKESRLDNSIGEIICVSSEEAIEAAKFLERKHNLCVGISSGANYIAAQKLRKRFENVVTIFPDGFNKYKSKGLKHCHGNCQYESLSPHIPSRDKNKCE